MLAGGGIAVAAAAGGWFFILQDDGDVSGPDSPGESFDSAPAVSAGRDEPYEINNGEDHYFAVELDSGDQLEVTIEFEHQEGDLDMDLYDPSQTIRDSSISVSDDETGSLTAPESGTHYINPYGYAGASNTYELVVQIGE